ncbi:MAG TPA: pyridoxamine 5'-phosphate oxidase family protein [Verrucomicrobiae bacterium]|nr:pyridoxamine 5'-phosphate oxidase family protein [Verrucomicrobiae bacterium]
MAAFQGNNPESVINFIRTNLPRHKQFALSTVDGSGNPWTVCLNLSFDDELNIIWKSRKDTEHSQHILLHPQVAVCVFSEEEGVGDFGFYAKALAHEVTDLVEIEKCIAIRYLQKGKPAPAMTDFLGDSPDRLYMACLTEAWVNDDSHVKTPVALPILQGR